jgi:demethylmenaquinone methyltransferase/2-methoxy-6-polyprenyl-1,4-benzoquinol methylase
MAVTPDAPTIRNYDRVARYYESSARAFSLGQIGAAKRFSVAQMKPGEKVIFLGVGTGEDAILAVERGCNVTCVDISQKMLDRLTEKLRRRDLSATILCQNALDHDRLGAYDVCSAHFFFNMFPLEVMRRMLEHASNLLRPEGKLLIADVAPAQGNLPSRLANTVYLKSAMLAYWAMGLVAWHRNYEYADHFSEVGLRAEQMRHFKLFPLGPIVYQVTIGVKKGGASVM